MSGKGIKEKVTLKKGEKLLLELKHVDAIILSPSLGCPAIVRRKDDGTAFLELLIVCKKAVLTPAQVAYHVRLVPWQEKDRPGRYNQKMLKLFESYFIDVVLPVPVEKMVKISKCYTWNEDTFGLGDRGCDIEDKEFDFKLSMSNVFDWVMKEYGLKGYKHLFKIKINLQYEGILDNILLNAIWLEKALFKKTLKRPSMIRAARNYIVSRLPVTMFKFINYRFLTELAEFSKDVNPESPENTTAFLYHPVYLTSKTEFNIGHVTDVHLDTRMEVYSQSEASVIELKENCGKNLKFGSNGRIVSNTNFFEPIKNKIANFNGFFVSICLELFKKGADLIVITGDLVDYNRGLHSAQTVSKKPEKPSKSWDELNRSYHKHQRDRNWFQFYKTLVSLYDSTKKPIFTLLGNHDYVEYAMAPWPVGGAFWDGIYDQNLTRYESALMFGEHDMGKFGKIFGWNVGSDYKTDMSFILDGFEHVECAIWYSFFINPFADYVVDLGKQSLFMVDWGCDSDIKKSKVTGCGGLHHSIHAFKGKMDFGKIKSTEKGPEYSKNLLQPPFIIRSGDIFRAWCYRHEKKTQLLFMHPTAICPRDDVSEYEIENGNTWKSSKLKYGSFDHNRDLIINRVESGHINMVVTGHSHRNLAMDIRESHHEKVRILSAGEVLSTEFREAKHIVMVTSSAGPLPKYLPGAPLICGCDQKNRYNKGYYYDHKTLWTLDDHKKPVKVPHVRDQSLCPVCGMHGFEMKAKPARRHKPGGNLLSFKNGQVSINTVLVKDSVDRDHPLKIPKMPRMGPMCEEWEVMMGDMELERIKNEKAFNDLYTYQTINIISREPFKRFSHMEFPGRVTYVTFDMGDLAKLVKNGTSDKVRIESVKDLKFWVKVHQTVVKRPYDTLMKSAKNDDSMAFMRYAFTDNQTWDREIDITKNIWAKTKDRAEKIKIASKNAGEWAKSFVDTDYTRKTYSAKYDPFEGMIILFKTEPDFRKRKNPHVCGY